MDTMTTTQNSSNTKWKIGDECYFLSNYEPLKAYITFIQGDFCVIRYGDGKGIRLRQTKLYNSELEAYEAMRKYYKPKRKNQYDYYL